jgi:hypothetical protein
MEIQFPLTTTVWHWAVRNTGKRREEERGEQQNAEVHIIIYRTLCSTDCLGTWTRGYYLYLRELTSRAPGL